MDRRRFLGGIGSSLLLSSIVARAQPATKIQRIGVMLLPPLDTPGVEAYFAAFRQGLREHGLVEGKNLLIEYRSADGHPERLPALANELASLRVDVIAVASSQSARAALEGSAAIPIVAGTMGDPVAEGLAASLARPGGRVTGLTFLGPELVPKRFEMLREMLPGITRVTGLWQRGAFGERTTDEMFGSAQAAAQRIGARLQLVGVRTPDELGGVLSTISHGRPDAVIVFPGNWLVFESSRIARFAAEYRLPAMYYAREFVAAGGLISYGPSYTDLYRRMANHIHQILKGASPGDLPIEQPTTFELAINIKTAKALGLTIPQSLLLRADEVIR